MSRPSTDCPITRVSSTGDGTVVEVVVDVEGVVLVVVVEDVVEVAIRGARSGGKHQRQTRRGEGEGRDPPDIERSQQQNDSGQLQDGVGDADIVSLEIPTGLPIVYELAADLSVERRYYLEEV